MVGMNERIIDIHAHVFPDRLAVKASGSIGHFYGMNMECDGSVSGLIRSGTAAGKDWTYVISSSATRPEQVVTINDFLAEETALHGEFVGFGTIHPDFPDVEDEIERLISIGLKGLKLHPDLQDYPMDDEKVWPIYKAAERRLPILMHMGDAVRDYSSPKRLLNVLERFPHLTVIAAHLGGYRDWDEATLLADAPVYLDTSSALFELDPGTALGIIRRHGVERILFGTDYPMWNHSGELARFDRLDLSDTERALILHGNASRLLGLLP
jgi:uncharacterized protein